MSRLLRGPGDCAAVLDRGHVPAAQARIGLEYERFVLRADGAPVPYSGRNGVEALLGALQQLTRWSAVQEGSRLLGLRAPDGRSFSLEPGAQLEYGSRPHATVAALAAELADVDAGLAELCAARGLRLVAAGVHPSATPEQLERIPKARYARLEPYLRGAGELGVWMMKCTAGVQFSLDHASAADAMRKLRLALRLTPVLLAWSANSPRAGYASYRGHIWTRTDPARCGIPAALAAPASGLPDYVDWALDAPPVFLHAPAGLRAALDAGALTEEDWKLHLSTLYPDARLLPGRLELRCFDSVPPPLALGFAVLVRNVCERAEARAEAEALVAAASHADLLEARAEACRRGRTAPALAKMAEALLRIAGRGPEAEFLEPLRARLAAA